MNAKNEKTVNSKILYDLNNYTITQYNLDKRKLYKYFIPGNMYKFLNMTPVMFLNFGAYDNCESETKFVQQYQKSKNSKPQLCFKQVDLIPAKFLWLDNDIKTIYINLNVNLIKTKKTSLAEDMDKYIFQYIHKRNMIDTKPKSRYKNVYKKFIKINM